MGLFSDIRKITRAYPDVRSIARRMFVTNSLDGIVAAMGIDVGGFSDKADPLLIASSIIGGTVAMGIVSGMIGVYVSERAERMKEYKELERRVASSLKDSIYWKAARLIPVYVALWSGMGIVLFPLLIAVPYIIAASGGLSVRAAYYSSMLIGLALMGFLGYFLGRVSRESIIVSVLRVLAMGVIAIVIVKLLRLGIGLG
ncbi:MAG: hypothetical protein LRS48_02470 [Desulfurococcales archaeon]|nr:hypothetical protein [Desulfurococcales archaeon]